MDMTKIIQILSEAIDDKDWDVIKELLEDLIYEEENPIQHYEKDSDVDDENDYRLCLCITCLCNSSGFRRVLFFSRFQ